MEGKNNLRQNEMFKAYEMGLQGSYGLAFKNVRQLVRERCFQRKKRLSILGKLFV
jgi:hypothetical protein